MRCSLAAALLVFSSSGAFAGEEIGTSFSLTCLPKWPDLVIPVPDLVHAFIVAECDDYAGTTDEDVDSCIISESHGYRATIMMLSDPETGETAADRYRACRAGLGMQGGRFYRRRAQCIGSSFGYLWRFEDTRRASIPQEELLSRTAAKYAGSTILDGDHYARIEDDDAQNQRHSEHSWPGAYQ